MATVDRLSGLDIGTAFKPACYVASTATLTLSGEQTIDGISVTSSQRVLVKDQTTTTQNGIYDCSSDTWKRSRDFNGIRDAIPGTIAYVDRGTVSGRTFWAANSSSTAISIVIDTDNVTWSNVTPSLTDVSAGTVIADGSTAEKALSARFAEIANITDFIAVGTASTADVTTAVQAAVDSGKTAVWGPGSREYFISDTIDFSNFDGRFYGDGQKASKFTMTASTVPIFSIGTASSNEFTQSFENISIAYSAAQTSSDAKCIDIADEFFMGKISNVNIENGAYGIYSSGQTVSSNLFENIRMRLASHTFLYLRAGDGNTGNHFSNIYMSGDRSSVLTSTCVQAAELFLMSDGVFNQVNAEWMAPTSRVFTFTRCNGITMNGVHIEGVSLQSNQEPVFYLLGSAVQINGARLNNVNFSGGNTNPSSTGSVANGYIAQCENSTATSEESVLEMWGTNANCVPAVTNTRVVLSNNPHNITSKEDVQITVPSWLDRDSIFEDARGSPNVNFASVPSTAYMPVMRQYNNVFFSPYVKADNPTGVAAGNIVLWGTDTDNCACYSSADGKFTAPGNGDYQVSFNLATTGLVDIRSESTAGAEQTAQRYRFGSDGTYSVGSAVIQRLRSEKLYIFTNSSNSTDVATAVTVRMMR